MGLKPRAETPIELSMASGSADYSARAVVDLRTGRCLVSETRRAHYHAPWKEQSVECTVSPMKLSKLRAVAAQIVARGDAVYRDQFAQMGVSFSVRSRSGVCTTADFHIDVGAGTQYDHAWDIVFRRAASPT